MRRLALVLSWALAVLLTAAEALLARSWIEGARYVARYGAAENPYAAENAEIAGICALLLLPLVVSAAALAVYCTVYGRKKRAEAWRRDRGDKS